MATNPLGWIEIPVTNCTRAASFYNYVFDWTLEFKTYGKAQIEMAMFPENTENPGAGGALVCQPTVMTPSSTLGPLVYFTCIDAGNAAEKSERAGGRIEMPKTPLPSGQGYFSVVLDSEGNRIGFYSKS